MQRLATVAAVNEHTDLALQGTAALDLLDRAHQKPLQRRHARFVCADLARDLDELAALIGGHREQRVPRRPRRGDAVQMCELLVGVDPRTAPGGEPMVELGRRRHRRGAGMTRDDNCAAGIGDARRLGETLAAQQPRHQSGEERITGTQHVEHLDALAVHGLRIVDPIRHRRRNEAAPERAALDDERRRRHRAHAPQ